MEHKHESVKLGKSQGEKKTAFVVLFSAATMVLEIFFGLFSNSMALLADGIHMGSHVLAIGLSWGLMCWCAAWKRNMQTTWTATRYSLCLRIQAAYYCSCSHCSL